MKNIDVSGLDYKQRSHLAAIINTYGENEGPLASEETLPYFRAPFVHECLDTAFRVNDDKERRAIIENIRKGLGNEEA